MGAVNTRYRAGRPKPWRAQWYEREGGKLRPREKWFAGPPPPPEQPDWVPEEVAKFKAQHEDEAQKFEELAMSSRDRARWWRINEDCRSAGVGLEEAVAAGLDVLKKRRRTTESLGTALGLWELDAKARKLRGPSIASMRQTVGAYAKGRAGEAVDVVRAGDLLLWVASHYTDQTSRDDVLGRLLTFFRWCASRPREWARLEEFVGVKFEHKVKGDKMRIGFYSSAEARALLGAVNDKLKVAIATGFFTGVRPIELQKVRIAWEHKGETYGFDEARGEWRIAPEWAKTRAYRKLYALPDCWWYWWIKYKSAIVPDRRSRHRGGCLVPMNYRNFRAALKAARLAAGIRKNPHDGIRHSFGTHGFHRSADGKARGVEWCIALMGHVGGFRIFETSYNGKVSEAEAEEYFQIYPDGAACAVETRARIIVDG